jgi:hypothetical protein
VTANIIYDDLGNVHNLLFNRYVNGGNVFSLGEGPGESFLNIFYNATNTTQQYTNPYLDDSLSGLVVGSVNAGLYYRTNSAPFKVLRIGDGIDKIIMDSVFLEVTGSITLDSSTAYKVFVANAVSGAPHYLTFTQGASSNEQMYNSTSLSYIPSSGNLGIGTGAPRGKLEVNGVVIPSACNVYDLGSSTLRWRDLYLSGNTIDLEGVRIGTSNNNAITLPNAYINGITYLGSQGANFPAPVGSAPLYGARAWVAFTYSGGVITINNSRNVSSVSRVTTGTFTVTFTVQMPSIYYVISGTAGGSSTSTEGPTVSLDYTSELRTITSARIIVCAGTSRARVDTVPFITAVFHI